MLREAGYRFRIGPFPDVDETPPEGMDPPEAARHLAERKARAVGPRVPHAVLVAADTVVHLGDEILGKPRDAADAARMLRRLSGCEHAVATGVAVLRGERLVSGVDVATVRFRPLLDAQVRAYVATGEGLDKAGAYGIQGRAAAFVEDRQGALDTVIGLPLDLLRRLLEAVGGG